MPKIYKLLQGRFICEIHIKCSVSGDDLFYNYRLESVSYLRSDHLIRCWNTIDGERHQSIYEKSTDYIKTLDKFAQYIGDTEDVINNLSWSNNV
jgi:hypothetical protein